MRHTCPEYRLQKTHDIMKLVMDINRQGVLDINLVYSSCVFEDIILRIKPVKGHWRNAGMLLTDFTIDPAMAVGHYSTAEQVIHVLEQINTANDMEVAA